MEMETTKSRDYSITSDDTPIYRPATQTSTTEIPITEKPVPQYGWVCPLCGRANAPFVRSCDCAGTPNTALGDLEIDKLIYI